MLFRRTNYEQVTQDNFAVYHDVINTMAIEKGRKSNRKNIISVRFLLCGSCFWCASLINIIDGTIGKCPSCKNNRVESMPVSYDDFYKFDYDPKRGVTLEFLKVDEEGVLDNYEYK